MVSNDKILASDYVNNINNVVCAINGKIDDLGSLNKSNALEVRADLREHVLRNARHLSSVFKESYPHDVQIPDPLLQNLNLCGVRIVNDLENLRGRLTEMCERNVDKVKTSARIDHILKHVNTYLAEVAKKIESNESLISHGINQLSDIDTFIIQEEAPQNPLHHSLQQLAGYELPAWGKGNSANF